MARQASAVLIVEDVATLARTYMTFLTGEPLSATTVATGAEALARLEKDPPAVLVLDVNLPDMNGLDILAETKRRGLPTEVVVVTSNASINLAIDAMRQGAFDFIVKPFSADRLRVTVRNALERHRLTGALEMFRSELGGDEFCGFIGNSVAMQAVYQMLSSAAPSRASVFVTGESGTGKELCAEAIHKLSKRSSGPFIAVNCAAIPEDLLESELFGHVKGAFTGATGDRLGAALRANGGTLFLDEIGEMKPDFQAKLLRFLQSGSIQRVGEDKQHTVDVRIVCATNRDPRAEVAAGRFREDLFYRLYVIPVELPPLREREHDVVLLARRFLEYYSHDEGISYTGFTPEADDALLRYPWPGNVRELQNVIRKIVVLGKGPVVGVGDLPPEISRPAFQAQGNAGPASFSAPTADLRTSDETLEIVPLQDTIDNTIDAAIARLGGSIPKAAAALKVSPSTIYRRLQARSAIN